MVQVDVGWVLLPFALIPRLNRPASRLEWLPVLALLPALIAMILRSPDPEFSVWSRAVLTLRDTALVAFGLASWRFSDFWLRILKVAVFVFAVGSLTTMWIDWQIVQTVTIWRVARVIVVAVIILGLLFPINAARVTRVTAAQD